MENGGDATDLFEQGKVKGDFNILSPAEGPMESEELQDSLGEIREESPVNQPQPIYYYSAPYDFIPMAPSSSRNDRPPPPLFLVAHTPPAPTRKSKSLITTRRTSALDGPRTIFGPVAANSDDDEMSPSRTSAATFRSTFFSRWPRVEPLDGIFLYTPMFVIMEKSENSDEKSHQLCCIIVSSSIWRKWEHATVYSGDATKPVHSIFGAKTSGQFSNECVIPNIPISWATADQQNKVSIKIDVSTGVRVAAISFDHSVAIAADLESIEDRHIQSGEFVVLESVDTSEGVKYLNLHAKQGKFRMSDRPSIVRIDMIPGDSMKVQLAFPHEKQISKVLVVEVMDQSGNAIYPAADKLQDRDIVSFSLDLDSENSQKLEDKVQLARPISGEYLVLQKPSSDGLCNCFRIVRWRKTSVLGTPTEVLARQSYSNHEE